MTRGGGAEDLAVLLALRADGTLDPHIGWRAPWEQVDDAFDALLGRRVAGKVVLDVA